MELLRAEQHQRKRPKHAWEKDSWSIPTFVSTSVGATFKLGRTEHLLAELREPSVAAPHQSDSVKLPVLPYAARKAKMIDWPDVSDDMKRKSLHLIRIMVESDFHATKLGSVLYELSGALDKEPQIQRSIELTFAKKSVATLHKRTLAFWKMFKFHSDKGYKSGLHMSEASVFAYIDSLKGKSPSAPQSCLEALNFMHSLLGIRTALDDLVSPRPLTADEVRFLEKLVLKSPDTAVVCIAGFFLFVLSNSARMTSGEGTLLLREVLRQMGSPLLEPLPSSHSLKVTVLSWLCKSGQFSLVERQIVGHHLDRPSTSALTYGRANFVGPMVKISAMLGKMHDGSFRPDASAADLIAQQLVQEELTSDELERKLHGDPQACEDSASDDVGHDEADDAVVEAVPAAERRMIAAPDPDSFLVHLASGTLHC
ncbi:unnamed protein product [Symbiodinium sp. KB8]|nr:unnamed protein product [Symbiodinium sp. KB8]